MDKHEWYADSGATSHMTDKRYFFETFQSFQPGNRTIRCIVKDNALLSANGIGSTRIKRKFGGKWSLGIVHNVLYVPNLGANLFSIGVATQRGVTATFQDDGVTLSKNGKNFASGIVQERIDIEWTLLYQNQSWKQRILLLCCTRWKHSTLA